MSEKLKKEEQLAFTKGKESFDSIKAEYEKQSKADHIVSDARQVCKDTFGSNLKTDKKKLHYRCYEGVSKAKEDYLKK